MSLPGGFGREKVKAELRRLALTCQLELSQEPSQPGATPLTSFRDAREILEGPGPRTVCHNWNAFCLASRPESKCNASYQEPKVPVRRALISREANFLFVCR